MAALLFVAVLVALLLRVTVGARWTSVVRGAVAPAIKLGAIGFAVGFFGPMVFAPGANQGPMLGIFITGPGGFLLGLIYGIIRELRQPSSSSTAS